MTVTDFFVPDVASAPAVMAALHRSAVIDYDYTVALVDFSGKVLDDITDHCIRAGESNVSAPHVTHTSTDTNPGIFTFTIDKALVWGADIVAPTMLLRAPGFAWPGLTPSGWVGFPLGAYIVASPEDAMRPQPSYAVTAYDVTYLLKSDVGDTFGALDGTYYSDNVAQLLSKAGITNAMLSGKLNGNIVNFPGDWAAKKIPTGTNMVYPSDDSNNYAYIDIINELLKASGCRPLYSDRNGKLTVEAQPTPTDQANRWTFSRTATSYDPTLAGDGVLNDGTVYSNDLWNIPNRWVFIQQGLTFDPVEGSGQYTINNDPSDSAHYRVGSDQQTIGRVITSVQHLNASGQDDLVKQGEAIFTAQFAQAETLTLKTAPWPCAWHFDVFRYCDSRLPRVEVRKAQAQSWELALDGMTDMTWAANVVGTS